MTWGCSSQWCGVCVLMGWWQHHWRIGRPEVQMNLRERSLRVRTDPFVPLVGVCVNYTVPHLTFHCYPEQSEGSVLPTFLPTILHLSLKHLVNYILNSPSIASLCNVIIIPNDTKGNHTQHDCETSPKGSGRYFARISNTTKHKKTESATEMTDSVFLWYQIELACCTSARNVRCERICTRCDCRSRRFNLYV